jgi:xanthine permease XanP
LEGSLPLLFGMTMFAGAVEMGLSRVLRPLRPYFPPEISGLVVTIMGISAGLIGVRHVLGIGTGQPAGGREVIVAAVTLGTAVALTVWGARHARMFCGLMGTVRGTMAAATLGIVSGADFASIASAPLVSIPRIGHLRWSFDFALMAPFAVIAAAGCLVVMGNVTTCQKINDREWTRPDMRSITGGVVADGLGSICAGLLGTVPMNSASSNVGLTTATGVTSRVLAYVMGGMFLVLALTPKASAVLAVLPRPVIGATLVFTACFILVNGLGIITSRLVDARKTIVIGMGLFLGVTAEVYATLFANLDTLWRPLVGSSVVFATLSAVVLNLVFRLGARRSQALVVESKAVDPSVLHDFMETWGSRWGARRDVIDRATFSLAQSIEIIIEGCAPGSLQIEASFDEFNLDVRVSYDGAPLELPEQRPTNAEIMASEDGQRKLAGFMLRRYADRVQATQRDGRSTIFFHFDH